MIGPAPKNVELSHDWIKAARHRCADELKHTARVRSPLVVDGFAKLGFSLELLLQAVDRMRATDEVWLAVPATRRGRDRDRRVHRVCRLIGFGLMAVDTARDRVEVLAEPGPYRPRPDQRRRARLLSEHARRVGDPSPGGTSRLPVMTAYRQRALACAAQLQAAPCRPRDLRTVAHDSGGILLRNVYGWFERTERGRYRLTSLGEAALQQWPDIKRHEGPIRASIDFQVRS